MSVAVRYYSRGGNTKKLADAIAEVAQVEALSTEAGLDGAVDTLFLGASVYAYGIDEHVKSFISKLDSDQVGKIVVFSTSALAERAFPEVARAIQDLGIKVDERNFYCRGSFLMMHRGRPNDEDIANAKAFAEKVLMS